MRHLIDIPVGATAIELVGDRIKWVYEEEGQPHDPDPTESKSVPDPEPIAQPSGQQPEPTGRSLREVLLSLPPAFELFPASSTGSGKPGALQRSLDQMKSTYVTQSRHATWQEIDDAAYAPDTKKDYRAIQRLAGKLRPKLKEYGVGVFSREQRIELTLVGEGSVRARA